MAMLEINWRPSNRDLRIFAGVQWIVAALAAWLLHRRMGWDAASWTLVAASTVGMIAGLASPQILRPLFVAWMVAAFPIGWVMSHVVLAIVYYGVVTPIGIGLRLSRRDSLQRKSRPDATTYWIKRSESPEPAQYFRQF